MEFKELLREIRQQAETDAAMLESMASSFRGNLDFSFNGKDMADLLDRIREEHYSHLVG